MKAFLAILSARNKEYYRDKASLGWAFMFPLVVIVACAVAFSNPDTSIFRVGVHGEPDPALQPFLDQPWIKTVPFERLDRALERTQHHQLDLLLSSEDGKRYWVNTESTASAAAEQLLLAAGVAYERQQISGRKVRYVDWVIPGVLGMNLMFGALFGVGYVIVRYRHNGVLKRLQATPASALEFLSAQLASRLMIVVVVNSLIFIGCVLLLDLIVLGSYLSLLLVTLLGGIAMIALGLLVACRTASEELAGGLLNLATWPMLFMSEVWFSLDDAPPWMQALSNALPLTHIVKGFRSVMIEGATLGEISHHLLWLAVMTVVTLGLASALFRWHKR